MRLGVIVGVALIASSAAASTSADGMYALTKDQAYRSARACLLSHGARVVGRRPNGGGCALLRPGLTLWTCWTYRPRLGQVSSVAFYFAGVPPPTRAERRTVHSCLTKGIRRF